jgi:1-deoxy-D-xylulose-5-phosphate reductoisomerase
MAAASPEQACAHPRWQMGRKISVDSATLMNKGLELIEACLLFGTEPRQVEVVVHPQSIVHSLVEYVDGSVLAQLGNPDMRTPIAHALGWPERIASGVESLDLVATARLDFEAPDVGRFPVAGAGPVGGRSGWYSAGDAQCCQRSRGDGVLVGKAGVPGDCRNDRKSPGATGRGVREFPC